MKKPIKYKRISEVHNEETINDFFDRLITEGWEIIYYNEIKQASGVLSNSLNDVNIHVTVIVMRTQDNKFL